VSNTTVPTGRIAAAITLLVESLASQAVSELERYTSDPGRLEEAARLLDEAAATVRSLHALAHPT
jgi:hypothetical protein